MQCCDNLFIIYANIVNEDSDTCSDNPLLVGLRIGRIKLLYNIGLTDISLLSRPPNF